MYHLVTTTHAICGLSFHLPNYSPTLSSAVNSPLPALEAQITRKCKPTPFFLSPPPSSLFLSLNYSLGAKIDNGSSSFAKSKTSSSSLPFELETRTQTDPQRTR